MLFYTHTPVCANVWAFIPLNPTQCLSVEGLPAPMLKVEHLLFFFSSTHLWKHDMYQSLHQQSPVYSDDVVTGRLTTQHGRPASRRQDAKEGTLVILQ